jgi:2'-5' RNA ligase
MVIRSFLAFELPVDIKRMVSQVCDEMRRSGLDIRWVKPDRIHLTMVFMGNILQDQVEEISKAAETVCQKYGGFNVFSKAAGVFGGKRYPRVLWIGLGGDVERMASFRDDLQVGLRPFGIEVEKRPFRPHLTLGRFRKGVTAGARLDELLSRYQDLTSPTCAFEELVLFKSELKPEGAVHTKLNAWPLAGER